MWTKEDYELSMQLRKYANEGARKAREAAQKAGLPIVHSLNGRLFFQLADGTITEDRDIVNGIYERLEKSLKPRHSDKSGQDDNFDN